MQHRHRLTGSQHPASLRAPLPRIRSEVRAGKGRQIWDVPSAGPVLSLGRSGRGQACMPCHAADARTAASFRWVARMRPATPLAVRTACALAGRTASCARADRPI